MFHRGKGNEKKTQEGKTKQPRRREKVGQLSVKSGRGQGESRFTRTSFKERRGLKKGGKGKKE